MQIAGKSRHIIIDKLIIILSVSIFFLYAMLPANLFAESVRVPPHFMGATRGATEAIYQLNYSNSSIGELSLLLETESKGGTKPDDSKNLKHTVKTNISGMLSIKVLESMPSGQLALVQIRRATVNLIVDGKQSVKAEEEIARIFNDGLRILVNPNGSISGIFFDTRTQNVAKEGAKQIISLLQMTLPANGKLLPEWQSVEMDQSGSHNFSYKIIKPRKRNADILVQKRKISQIKNETHLATGRTVSPEYRPEGTIEFLLDKNDGVLRRLNGKERSSIYLFGVPVGSSETKIELQLKSQLPLDENVLAALQKKYDRYINQPLQPLWQQRTREDSLRLLARQLLADDTDKSLFSELDKLVQGKDGRFNSKELHSKFKSLILLYPESCIEIVERLKAGASDGLATELLIGALSAAGTIEAQRTLISFAQSRKQDQEFLLKLIPIFGMFEAPAIEVEAFLVETMLENPQGENSFAASLALGAMAKLLSKAYPVRSEGIVTELVRRYSHLRNSRDVSRLLLALGNTGMVSALPAIERYINDVSADTRADAVHALRFIPGQVAMNSIANALTNDHSELVRREAAVALAFREEVDMAIAMLDNAKRNEKSAAVLDEIGRSLTLISSRRRL